MITEERPNFAIVRPVALLQFNQPSQSEVDFVGRFNHFLLQSELRRLG